MEGHSLKALLGDSDPGGIRTFNHSDFNYLCPERLYPPPAGFCLSSETGGLNCLVLSCPSTQWVVVVLTPLSQPDTAPALPSEKDCPGTALLRLRLRHSGPSCVYGFLVLSLHPAMDHRRDSGCHQLGCFYSQPQPRQSQRAFQQSLSDDTGRRPCSGALFFSGFLLEAMEYSAVWLSALILGMLLYLSVMMLDRRDRMS